MAIANVTVSSNISNISVDSSLSNITVTNTPSNIVVSSNPTVGNAAIRNAFSVTDAGGDGSLSYNSSTGVFTYTGPSAAEVRSHFSATSPISITSGVISINSNALFSGKTTDDLAQGSTNLYFKQSANNTTTGNIEAGYFIGDGSQLTNLNAASNADILQFLATSEDAANMSFAGPNNVGVGADTRLIFGGNVNVKQNLTVGGWGGGSNGGGYVNTITLTGNIDQTSGLDVTNHPNRRAFHKIDNNGALLLGASGTTSNAAKSFLNTSQLLVGHDINAGATSYDILLETNANIASVKADRIGFVANQTFADEHMGIEGVDTINATGDLSLLGTNVYLYGNKGTLRGGSDDHVNAKLHLGDTLTSNANITTTATVTAGELRVSGNIETTSATSRIVGIPFFPDTSPLGNINGFYVKGALTNITGDIGTSAGDAPLNIYASTGIKSDSYESRSGDRYDINYGSAVGNKHLFSASTLQTDGSTAQTQGFKVVGKQATTGRGSGNSREVFNVDGMGNTTISLDFSDINDSNYTSNFFKVQNHPTEPLFTIHHNGNVELGKDATSVHSITGNLDVAGNITATGNINYQNVTDLFVRDQSITLNANAATDATVSIIANRPVAGSNTVLRWNETSDAWQFTNDGSTYYNIPTSTSDLAEGTNLYFTDARFDTRLATKDTGDLAEGSNLYYTQGRFDTAFGNKTTSDLTEGTNQYYTDSRSRGAVSVTQASASGTGALAYDNSSGVFTYTPPDLTGTSLTNAQAQAFIQSSGLAMTANVTSNSLISTTGNLQVNADTTSAIGMKGLTYRSDFNLLGLGTTAANTGLDILCDGNQYAAIFLRENADTFFGPDLSTYKARGSVASPSAVSVGDRLMELKPSGYSGSGYLNTMGQMMFVDEANAISSTSMPIGFSWEGYKDGDVSGSPTYASLMKLRANGDFQIGSLGLNSANTAPNFAVTHGGTVSAVGNITTTANISGNYVLGNARATTGIITTNVAEGTNQYYTDARSRGAVSVTSASASGGGALAYDSGTGVFTFTPSVPGIALTDLSVTQASASGTGALAYNNSSGVFTYTPPDLTGTSLTNAQAQAFIQSNGLTMTAAISSNTTLGTTGNLDLNLATAVDNLYGVRFDSATNKFISSPTATAQAPTHFITVEKEGTDLEFISSRVARSGANGTRLLFEKSEGTLASPTALGNYDAVWETEYSGWDGNKYENSFGTHVFQDGRTASVSADTVPLAYEFYHKPGGDTTSSDISIMSLHSDGKIVFNDAGGTRGFNNKVGTANISADGSIESAATITGANVTATATLESEMLNAGSYTMNTAIYGNSITGNYDTIIVSAGNHEPNLVDGTPVVIADTDANNPFANGSIKANNTFYVRQNTSSSGYYFLYQQPDMATISTSGGSYFNTTNTCTFTFPTLNVTANVTMGPDSAFRQGSAYAYNQVIGQSLEIGEAFNRNAQLDVSGDTTITNYSGNAALTLVNNINSATVPTQLVMKQNKLAGTAAGVAGDALSVLKTQGMTANTSVGLKTYANVVTSITDPTDSAEHGEIDFRVITAGTETSKMLVTSTNVHIDTVKPVTSLGNFTLQGNVVIDKADFTASGTANNAITAIISHGNQGGTTTADSIVLTTELADGTAVSIQGISSADDDASGSYTEVNNQTFYTKKNTGLGFGNLGVGLFDASGSVPTRLMTGDQFKGSPSGSPVAIYAAGTFIDVKDANLEVKGHTTLNSATIGTGNANLVVQHVAPGGATSRFTRINGANVDIMTPGSPTINFLRGTEGTNVPTFLRTSSTGPTSGTAGSFLETNAGTLALNSGTGANVLASIGVFTGGTTVQLGHDGASDEWRLNTVADTNYYRITTTDDFGKLTNLTTTQINAIASPGTGDMVFNTTENLVCVYNGTAWRKINDAAL